MRTSMQIITPNWFAEMKTKLSHTETFLEQSQQYPPGEKFEELYTKYIQSCNSCVDWIKEHYGSVPDLIDFMKRDIEQRAKTHGIVMDEYLAWETRPNTLPNGQEAAGTVQMLSGIVNYSYPDAERHLSRCIQYIQDNQVKFPQTYGPK